MKAITLVLLGSFVFLSDAFTLERPNISFQDDEFPHVANRGGGNGQMGTGTGYETGGMAGAGAGAGTQVEGKVGMTFGGKVGGGVGGGGGVGALGQGLKQLFSQVTPNSFRPARRGPPPRGCGRPPGGPSTEDKPDTGSTETTSTDAKLIKN